MSFQPDSRLFLSAAGPIVHFFRFGEEQSRAIKAAVFNHEHWVFGLNQTFENRKAALVEILRFQRLMMGARAQLHVGNPAFVTQVAGNRAIPILARMITAATFYHHGLNFQSIDDFAGCLG